MTESTAGSSSACVLEGEQVEPHSPPDRSIIPVSTYRLQFNSRFTFAEATRIIPYLRRLGISHCYASPYLKARPGSSHGYDIVDHNAINPEIGSLDDFESFIAELRRNGMALIHDLVPNHMGIMGSDNQWWLDVLENGQASAYASFFDIDWHPVNPALRGKILVPVLERPYGDTLEQLELKLVFDDVRGEFSIVYRHHRFPIDPQTYPYILNSRHETLMSAFAADDPVLLEFQTLENSFGKLPLRTEATEQKKGERCRDKEVFKKLLARLCEDNPTILDYLSRRVAGFNRPEGENSPLHALLEMQVFRLAYWRVAGDEINFRRFFDINALAGLRIEDEKVFGETHRFILSLIAQRKIQGLRIDHADGLYDPVSYYDRLNSKISAALNIEAAQNSPPIYVVAEKIVANYEYLSSDWSIHGTTGYEFANIVNGVFIDSASKRILTRCYGRFIRLRPDFNEMVYHAKKLVLTTMLASELNVLANRLNKIAGASYKTRDYTLNALRDALSEVIACFPVYRTYINGQPVGKKDSHYIKWAIEKGRQHSRAADKTVFDFIRSVLLLERGSPVSSSELLKFVMNFQQYTAPVMAKGYEDTALYQYHRLISSNEVGGDPRHFGYSVNAFHHFNLERLKKWPHSLLCLSTHDSKRSADMRARINVLSEIPREWQEAVIRWHKLNKPHRLKSGKAVIARNDEYLFYQTLIGTWPLKSLSDMEMIGYRGRIRDYMIKAVREAKLHTSWINPDESYERAVDDFVGRCLDGNDGSVFLEDFGDFERRTRMPGLLNALAQNVLQLTSPGVPDLYQGDELWQFNLVDPDNRRPVDFTHRSRLLDELDSQMAKPGCDRMQWLTSLLDTMEDGRIKLLAITLALRFRLQHSELFEAGDYLKINVHGKCAEHLLAFARMNRDEFAIIAVPRLTMSLFQDRSNLARSSLWADTWLELPLTAPVEYQSLYCRRRLSATPSDKHLNLYARDVLGIFPLAILSAPPFPLSPASRETAL
ncbi:MAG: malto-oligosyltrehalose synthase [Gammaproteobacteria bacterium]